MVVIGLFFFCDIKASSEEEKALFDTGDRRFISRYLASTNYLPTSEIKPGMTGYGLSVFRGTKIEKFDVQVIGVVKKVLSGKDAILVRLSGPTMEKNNVIKGMSGSPVYINGRLVGAISFGYDFSTEPIAGITPIVDMLDALADSSTQKTPIAKLQERSINIPWNSSGLSNTGSGELKMIPLVSPVALAGFSPRAESFLSKRFGDIGMKVTSGTAGALNSSLAAGSGSQIKPGSSVSILLSSGDFTSVATGTTTARFGNKVLAFGHPFLAAGSIEFPMATAYVHKVLPSLAVSFKIASPINEVGSFTADRPWSCGGQIGHQAKMVQAAYTIVDETRKIQRSFNCKIIDHPDLTPQLLAAATMSAIDATHQYSGPYIAKVESRLEAEGIEPIVHIDRFASNIAPHSILEALMSFAMGDSVSGYVYRSAASITNNEYQKASVKSFKIKVTLEDGHQTANIDRVYLEKSYAAPGDEVKVLCLLKPYNQEAYTETMSFRIPRDAVDGNLAIGIAGGNQIDYVRNRLGITDPDPESLDQIAQELRREGSGDELNLSVALPEQSLLLGNVKINDPPSHWSKVLFSNRHTKGPQVVKGELRSSKNTPYLLNGSHIITIEVRNPDKAMARTAPASIQSNSGGDNPAMTELARKALGSSFSSGKDRSSSPARGIVLQLSTDKAQESSTSLSSSSSTSTTSKTSASTSTLFMPPGKGYPHMRSPQIWRQETEEEFRNGKCEGSTVDSWGRVGPGLDNSATLALSPETNIWSACYANGSAYFAAANKLWRWQGNDSKLEPVCQLKTTLIPSLACDAAGTVYAACVPQGEVHAVAADGTSKVVFKAAETVITSLCCDDAGNLYVGVAGKGKVYKIDKERNSTMIFDSGQAHVTALFYCRQDRHLYVGTAEKAAVYALDPEGKAKAIYQSADHLVTGVAKTKNGDIYVASSSTGKLVRVLPSGEAVTLANSETFYALHYNEKNDLLFSGDAEGDITLACLEPTTKEPFFIPVCHTDQEAVMALASSDTQLFAGSSNLALLKAFNLTTAKNPYYESSVRDAGRVANWTRLRAYGPFTEAVDNLASGLSVESRSGQTSKADKTWSEWSQAKYDGESYVLTSPEGRYLQYRLNWLAAVQNIANKKTVPQVGRVDVIYTPKDLAPKFSTISLKPASANSGKNELSITGTDADGDNLLLSLEISSDAGKTWQKLASDLRSKSAKKEAGIATTKRDKDESLQKMKGALDRFEGGDMFSSSDDAAGKTSVQKIEKEPQSKHKSRFSFNLRHVFLDQDENAGQNKPDEDKQDEDKNSADKKDDADKDKKTDDSIKEKSESDNDKNDNKKVGKEKSSGNTSGTASTSTQDKASSSGSSTETFSWSWDTTKYKDGHYILKFTLDDRISNPEDTQQAVNLRAVDVDNTAPEITLIKCQRKTDNTVECKVVVVDKTSPVANATYRIDDGDYFTLAATPESEDGLTVNLIATNIQCSSSAHKIEVKVSDRAGNTATKSATIK